MRKKLFFLPLALCVLAAGCVTDDVKETGITRAAAISIAENHCPQYPDRFGYVDRAEWNADGKYWLVALTDDPGNHGRAFKINRAGHVIDSHVIDRGDDNSYGPGYGPGHAAYWYYW